MTMTTTTMMITTTTSVVLYDDFIITPQVTSDFMERREILMGHVNFLIENDMLDYVR